jgi:signal transduction histidine kinase
VRRSTAVLMPPALVELGLRGALVRHCEAVAQATGLEVSFEAPDPMPAVAAHVETACYRVVQEALTNVARHAGAKRAWVSVSLDRLPPRDGLEGEPALRFEVRDDGRGLASGAPRGSGLESIAERARLLGGEASFADAGPGLRVRVTVPLTERSP